MTLATRKDELEEFKSQINLCEYASSRGYTLDRKESCRSSAVMRHPNGDKLLIGRTADQLWLYWNVHDKRDQGSIIDLCSFVIGEPLATSARNSELGSEKRRG